MQSEKSGIIYQLNLRFDLGYTYIQLLNFLDISFFDGILIYVYDNFNQPFEMNNVQDYNKKIALGPLRINKNPSNKIRSQLFKIGVTEVFISDQIPPSKEINNVKQMTCLNWNLLSNCYKYNQQLNVSESYDHDKIRYLETCDLHDYERIIDKTTIYWILKQQLDLTKYYDIGDSHIKMLFADIINTYFSEEEATRLANLYYPCSA